MLSGLLGVLLCSFSMCVLQGCTCLIHEGKQKRLVLNYSRRAYFISSPQFSFCLLGSVMLCQTLVWNSTRLFLGVLIVFTCAAR